MDTDESYAAGLFADTSSAGHVATPWTNMLEWDGQAFWVVVHLSDLVGAVPEMDVQTATSQHATVEIARAPEQSVAFGPWLESLEKQGLPAIAFLPNLKLLISGGVLTRHYNGDTYLVSQLTLIADSGRVPVSYRLPSRMLVTRAPGGASMVSGSGIVPQVEVPCVVTGSSLRAMEITEPWGVDFSGMAGETPVFLNDDYTGLVELPPGSVPHPGSTAIKRRSTFDSLRGLARSLSFAGPGRKNSGSDTDQRKRASRSDHGGAAGGGRAAAAAPRAPPSAGRATP